MIFDDHHLFNIEQNIKDLFDDICQIENHSQKLEYFCKTHNQLCCMACLCKIKDKGNGQHKDCDVCIIENIKEEKKNILNENIQFLEDLSINIEQSINELKILFEKINKDKDILKLKIQNIFTNIRNTLNEREAKLLFDLDNQFNTLSPDINESEKLPKKIQELLENGKLIDKDWDDNNRLNRLINDCINIENNIKNINNINQKIKKYILNKNVLIKFNPEEDGINALLKTIKNFGMIYNNEYKFIFKKCPIYINENRKYQISGENNNILTKTGVSFWMGTICEKQFDKDKEYRWKIKILNSVSKNIMIGVATNDFDIHSSNYSTCGWYLYWPYSTLYSGPPHNYNNKETNLCKAKDVIEVDMNMEKKTLKFIIDHEDKGFQYYDIPTDKPLFPAVCLYDINDSIEIDF